MTISAGGEVRALYSDRLPLREVGRLTVSRASNVEFDERAQEWVAVTPDGREIARGRDRDAVIRREVEVLQEAL